MVFKGFRGRNFHVKAVNLLSLYQTTYDLRQKNQIITKVAHQFKRC